jgi:hypothetical protein
MILSKTIKIALFALIAAWFMAATMLFVKQYNNKPVQINSAQNEEVSQLDKHLLERMNHKIIDTSILKSNISFEQNIFDFGIIKSGDVVTHKFKFTNMGSNPLIIFNVKVSCGCTVPAWSNRLVNSRDTGSIIIEFKSAGEMGLQNKKVQVFANSAPMETDIFFKANVIN